MPSRILAATAALERFARAFFDENPLSRLGLVALRDKRAVRLTELSGSVKTHLAALKSPPVGPCIVALRHSNSNRHPHRSPSGHALSHSDVQAPTATPTARPSGHALAHSDI